MRRQVLGLPARLEVGCRGPVTLSRHWRRREGCALCINRVPRPSGRCPQPDENGAPVDRSTTI